MFDRRLRVLLILFGAALCIVVVRLGQLQIVQASYFRERAQRSLLLRPTRLPFIRGSVRDRVGSLLVQDVPTWDLALDYDVLAAFLSDKPDPMARQVRRFQRAGRYDAFGAKDGPEIERAFRAEMDEMWEDMFRFAARFQKLDRATLRDRAASVYARILRVRRAVAARRGFDAPVAEEKVPHPLVRDLSSQQQIKAREAFAVYPWVHVVASSRRQYAADSEAFAHVLGRVGRVTAEDVAADPNADDPFAKYRADETRGVTGVEWAGESKLRGRRGQIARDREGRLVAEETFDARDGDDVFLTINGELQRRLYRLLGEVVNEVPESSGGAIVVLDVSTREVLALVSSPSYDPNRFDELYDSLRADTVRMPLRFRAVASRYAPGSTMKPLVCLAGLLNGLITVDSRESCSGYLLDGVRNAWRCWKIHGTDRRMAHGPVNVVSALTGSCNVFMYRLGESLGADALCSVFDMAGVGKKTGLGLREEVGGINPTPGWLMYHKNSPVYPAHARNFAIGQGELSMTPVQVANLMATYASGRFRGLTLLRDAPQSPEWVIPATRAQWLAIRRGIYGVVNDANGTAYQYARLVNDRWALCGKTGSATAHPWPTAYRIRFDDQAGAEQFRIVQAGSKKTAIDQFLQEHPNQMLDPKDVTISTRWPTHPPPQDENFSHAWFGGFLQRLDDSGRPDWTHESPVAFAVIVEFGGSGGRTSGPLARRVSETLIDVFGADLEFGGVSRSVGSLQH